MTDKEFLDILMQLKHYLDSDKTFDINAPRKAEFEMAANLAHELFPEAKIQVKDDPLQMGAMILSVEDFDFDISGEQSIHRFANMTTKADNVEVYAAENGNVCIAMVFQNVLIRVQK